MMFASLADWTHEELVAAAMNEATRLSAAATRKRLEAAAEHELATNRMLEIERELTLRRQMFRKPDPDQKDHDEFVEEMSLGGRTIPGEMKWQT
jgi:hypothetical protein